MEELAISGGEAVSFLVKAGVITFIFVYVIFAALVVKQVRLMTETLDVGFDTQLRFLSVLHFAFAVVSLIFALVVV